MIGPFDLSKFMQVEFGGKEHEAAIAKILAAAKAANKTAAIFCANPPSPYVYPELMVRYIWRTSQEKAGSGFQHGFHHYRSCCCHQFIPKGIG